MYLALRASESRYSIPCIAFHAPPYCFGSHPPPKHPSSTHKPSTSNHQTPMPSTHNSYHSSTNQTAVIHSLCTHHSHTRATSHPPITHHLQPSEETEPRSFIYCHKHPPPSQALAAVSRLFGISKHVDGAVPSIPALYPMPWPATRANPSHTRG